MFNLFSKKESFKVVAPISGNLMSIEKVNDEVFSSKMMGDGFAIKPNSQIVYAPISGEVVTLFPTKHAVCIKGNDGLEVIVHVGIDTVNNQGKGFSAYIKIGDKIKQGQKMLYIEDSLFNDKTIDLTTMVVFTNKINFEINIEDKHIDAKQGIIK